MTTQLYMLTIQDRHRVSIITAKSIFELIRNFIHYVNDLVLGITVRELWDKVKYTVTRFF